MIQAIEIKVTGRNSRATQPQRTKYLVWEMKGGYEEVDKLASQTSHIEAIRNELWKRNCKPTNNTGWKVPTWEMKFLPLPVQPCMLRTRGLLGDGFLRRGSNIYSFDRFAIGTKSTLRPEEQADLACPLTARTTRSWAMCCPTRFSESKLCNLQSWSLCWTSKSLKPEPMNNRGSQMTMWLMTLQGCIFFPKIDFFINHYLEHWFFL